MKKGFTLLELIVAIGVFLTVISSITGMFVYASRDHQKTLSYQELLGQSSYIMEFVSRSLRMAQKDLDGSCIDIRANYQITERGGIKFKDYEGNCVEFFKTGFYLDQEKWIGGAPAVNTRISGGINVTKFIIAPEKNWGQEDNNQARVTLLAEFTGRNQTIITIQTTVSQRNLDIQQ